MQFQSLEYRQLSAGVREVCGVRRLQMGLQREGYTEHLRYGVIKNYCKNNLTIWIQIRTKCSNEIIWTWRAFYHNLSSEQTFSLTPEISNVLKCNRCVAHFGSKLGYSIGVWVVCSSYINSIFNLINCSIELDHLNYFCFLTGEIWFIQCSLNAFT